MMKPSLLLLICLSGCGSTNLARVEAPARAVAPLLSDGALRIPPSDIPSVKAAWRDDVSQRARPLRSLTSEDFSDLQFLKPLLAGKRVVQLGESGHGVAEFNSAKVRLVKFLHEQMGYDVVAFESSLAQCYRADKAIGSLAPSDVMRRCVFPVWHSAEVLSLFDYLDQARRAGQRLNLAGFDTQNSAPASALDNVELGKMLTIAQWPRASEVALSEAMLFTRRINKVLPPAVAQHVTRFYSDAAAELTRQRPLLSSAGLDADDVAVAIQAARSRARLAQQFAGGPGNRQAHETRDDGMAENLDFLLDKLYPGRKVIVWAHNVHVGYQRELGAARQMGAQLAARRKAELYTVGLYMGRGSAGNNNHSVYSIAAPPADTFEAVMANSGVKYSFVDFSRASASVATEWMFAPITLREWGVRPLKLIPALAYDAVLYIDTVTPPDYR